MFTFSLTGEFFMKERERKLMKMQDKSEKKVAARKRQEEKRAAPFVPPTEPDTPNTLGTSTKSTVDITKFKAKIKQLRPLQS